MNVNQHYHNKNNEESKAMVLNTIREAERRKKMLLNPMPPRLNGRQKGIVMFYTNPQKNCDCLDSVSGGSNITYSSGLSNNKYNEYNKKLLQQRVESLQAMKEEGVPPPQVELSPNEGDKLQANLTLDSITAQISEGDLNDVLSPLFRYIQYLVKNVYFFTNEDFIKYINIFLNLEIIVRTRHEAFRIREKYLTKGKYKKLTYGKETAFLLGNITEYLKLNMKGAGLDQQQRVILAKSTVYALKITTFERTMKQRQESKTYLDKMRDDATPPPGPLSSASMGLIPPPPPPPAEFTPPDPTTTLFP